MFVILNKENLLHFLHEDVKCWSIVSGGPNFDAFSFDPRTVDVKELKRLGYYDDRGAWMAGVQSKRIADIIQEIHQAPMWKAGSFK